MRTVQRLLVIGASARAAAASIKRAGIDPRAADLFCDVDLRAVCPCQPLKPYPDGALQVLKHSDADAWMYAGGFENYPDLVDRLASVLPLLGNSGDLLRQVRDPWRVCQVLKANEIAAPELAPKGGQPGSGDWFIKPRQSCGGLGIRRRNDASTWATAETTDSTFVYQQAIDGQPLGALFVANGFDARLLGVSEQIAGASWLNGSEFTYCGSIGPITLRVEATEQLKKIGRVLTAAFSLRGLFGVDVVWDEKRIWPIEVNPRYTASVEVIEHGRDISAIDQHIRGCRQRPLDADPAPELSERKDMVVGKAILYAEQSIALPTRLIDWVRGSEELEPSWSFADLPPADSRIRQGRPVLTLIARAPSAAEARVRLRAMATQTEKFILKPTSCRRTQVQNRRDPPAGRSP